MDGIAPALVLHHTSREDVGNSGLSSMMQYTGPMLIFAWLNAIQANQHEVIWAAMWKLKMVRMAT